MWPLALDRTYDFLRNTTQNAHLSVSIPHGTPGKIRRLLSPFATGRKFKDAAHNRTKKARHADLLCMVRPARFELATPWFEAKYSNPLSYGRVTSVIVPWLK